MDDPPYEPQALAHRSYSAAHDDLIPSSFAITEHPHEILHDDEPDELSTDAQLLAQDTGYNSSASSTQHSSSDVSSGDLEEERLGGAHSRTSSHSSVSSMPVTVLTHTVDGSKPDTLRGIHDHISSSPWDDRDIKPYGRMLHTIRQREAAFRKPSSVRAMQMHTEDEGDDEFLTPPKRKGGHRMSDISMRSSNSSPLKRSPYYSPTGSLSRPKPKKEYPLVLLHCNLLPPSLPIPGLVGYPDPKVLKEVLPLEYWKRWKLLEEKVGSGVLRDRGVLISHPEDMYDVLEERLLESLELQRPRLDHGHFIGHGGDSEKGLHSPREDGATDDEEGEECPDCGGRVIAHTNEGRKWELKVFAANGLMRAGAWAAAWKEMEKVDVEVGLWLPSEIRRALEKRLFDDETGQKGNQLEISRLQRPEIDVLRVQTPTSLGDAPAISHAPDSGRLSSPAPKRSPSQQLSRPQSPVHSMTSSEGIDLHTLLVNYIRILATDRRNVAIAMLSILVVFFAVDSKPRATVAELMPFPQDMLHMSQTPIMSLEQHLTVTRSAPTDSVATGLGHSGPSLAVSSISEVQILTETASSSTASIVPDTESDGTPPSAAATNIEYETPGAQISSRIELQEPHVSVEGSVDSENSASDTEPEEYPILEFGTSDVSIDQQDRADFTVEPAAVDHVRLSELVDPVVDPEQNHAQEELSALD